RPPHPTSFPYTTLFRSHGLAVRLVGKAVERRHRPEVLGVTARLKLRIGLAKVVARELRVGSHAARQQAAAQRAIGEHGEAMTFQDRKSTRLNSSHQISS